MHIMTWLMSCPLYLPVPVVFVLNFHLRFPTLRAAFSYVRRFLVEFSACILLLYLRVQNRFHSVLDPIGIFSLVLSPLVLLAVKQVDFYDNQLVIFLFSMILGEVNLPDSHCVHEDQNSSFCQLG